MQGHYFRCRDAELGETRSFSQRLIFTAVGCKLTNLPKVIFSTPTGSPLSKGHLKQSISLTELRLVYFRVFFRGAWGVEEFVPLSHSLQI